MNPSELERLLQDLPRCRVAVLGDFCLDVYWFVDLAVSEPSLETGQATHPVRQQRYALGGAGNVVGNLAALGCRNLLAFGAVGADPWGRELQRLLQALGADTAGLAVPAEPWATLAYVKPHLDDVEQHRLDFGNFNQLSDAAADHLLARLERALPGVDAVIVNEQVKQGLHTPALRRRLARLIDRHADRRFIVDSRHFSDAYAGACLKLNAHEAARQAGRAWPVGERVPRDETIRAAEHLFARQRQPVFVTRGSGGCLVRDAAGLHSIPGVRLTGPIDPVGAGDSMLAGIALGLAAGRQPAEAAVLGNLAAAVTVQKLRQTGTATPDEIRALGRNPANAPCLEPGEAAE